MLDEENDKDLLQTLESDNKTIKDIPINTTKRTARNI